MVEVQTIVVMIVRLDYLGNLDIILVVVQPAVGIPTAEDIP